MNIDNKVRKSIQTGWVLLFLAAAILFLSACNAGNSPKVYRVGVLSGLDYFAGSVDGFKNKMTELGYVEGENIIYDVQSTNIDFEAYQRILQQFVADKVDLIYVFPTEASIEAKAATEGTDIPVIFNFAFIDGTDIVESVREPGGNITGVRFPAGDIAAKRLEILRKSDKAMRIEQEETGVEVWIPLAELPKE